MKLNWNWKFVCMNDDLLLLALLVTTALCMVIGLLYNANKNKNNSKFY